VTLQSLYKAADGRDFPVEWTDAEQAAETWYWDSEHNPKPMAPLDFAAWRESRPGALRARREAGFPEWSFFGPTLLVHGFSFYHPNPMPTELADSYKAAAERAKDRYGSQARYWTEYCLPRLQGSIARLNSSSGKEPLRDLLEDFGYGFEHTFLFIEDGSALRNFCTAEFGEDGERLSVELTQGFPSATMEADQALWEVGRLASGRLRDALLSGDSPPGLDSLREVEGGDAFVSAFEAYLERYGWRTQDWDLSSPTWRERPEVPLAILRRTLAEDLPSPMEAVREAGRRRAAALATAEDRLAHDPEKLRQFRELAARTPNYLGVKEGRALWQLTLNGVLRQAILRKSDFLVAQGVIRSAEDVFYLTATEVDDPAAVGPGEVEARKRERERWVGVIPPSQIGGVDGGETETAPDAAPALEFKGIAASRGVVTARARVLRSIDEFDKLAAGEVLVCASTTPTWTPLFGIAGGLVTDGGGLLSHPAIAAREYAIPAVVGTRMATTTIPDGALVTVDGTAGTVRIEPAKAG
jgi:rifampicin phosphotransferase